MHFPTQHPLTTKHKFTTTMTPAQSSMSPNSSHNLRPRPSNLRPASSRQVSTRLLPLTSPTPTLSQSQSRPFARARKENSYFWNYFRKVDNRVHCILCESPPAKPRSYSSRTSLSNLKEHIRFYHGLPVDSQVTTSPPDNFGRLVTPSPTPEEKLSDHATHARPENSELIVIPSSASLPASEKNITDNATQLLVRMLVDNGLSPSLVEKQSFRDFVLALNPSYTNLTTHEVGSHIMHKNKEMETKICSTIANVKSPISLTCDMWSFNVSGGYFSITAHWLSDTFYHHNLLLQVVHFPPPHNSDSTMEIIMHVIERFDLYSRVESITTDSSSEMPKAAEQIREALNVVRRNPLSPGWHIQCTCHLINCIIKDCMTVIEPHLCRLRTLLKTARMSDHLKARFKIVQEEFNLPLIQALPELDVSTNWNSTYVMYLKCYQLRNVFDALGDNHVAGAQLPGITFLPSDWAVVHDVMEFFKKAADFMTSSSKNPYGTISVQPLVYSALLAHCERLIGGMDTPLLLSKAAMHFKDRLEKHESFFCSSRNQLALDLDPRSSKMGSDLTSLKCRLRNSLRDQLGVDAERQEAPTDMRGVLFAANGTSTQIDEVDSFCNLIGDGERSCADECSWWCDVGTERFPQLAKLARVLFLPKPFSIPSHLAFSSHDLPTIPASGRLHESKIAVLLKLRCWCERLGEMPPAVDELHDWSNDE